MDSEARLQALEYLVDHLWMNHFAEEEDPQQALANFRERVFAPTEVDDVSKGVKNALRNRLDSIAINMATSR